MLRALKYAPVWIALFASCKKGDVVPSYLQLGTLSVQTDPDTQGSGSQQITDVWVYVNDKPAGVWEAGSRLPVLASGATSVKLVAGVRRNGFRDDRIQYPFYDTWSTEVELVKEGTTTINPAFVYFDNSEFWIEDFEDPGFKLSPTQDSDTTMNLVHGPDTVLNGLASGELVVTTDRPFVRMYTTDPIEVGSPVFLELDYRSDQKLLIGALYTASGNTTTTDVPHLYLSPTLRADGGMPWNKVYVDLTDVMSVSGSTDKRFYLQVDLASGSSSGHVFIDDLKLVHH